MKKFLARAIYAVFGKSIAAERAEWRKHCMDMQNELNENNWNRYGWYKGSDGEMCFDWRAYVNKGKGLILRYDQI